MISRKLLSAIDLVDPENEPILCTVLPQKREKKFEGKRDGFHIFQGLRVFKGSETLCYFKKSEKILLSKSLRNMGFFYSFWNLLVFTIDSRSQKDFILFSRVLFSLENGRESSLIQSIFLNISKLSSWDPVTELNFWSNHSREGSINKIQDIFLLPSESTVAECLEEAKDSLSGKKKGRASVLLSFCSSRKLSEENFWAEKEWKSLDSWRD